MPFIRSPGLRGKLYVPAAGDADAKKHPCPDCCVCQQCSEGRCQVCRTDTKPGAPSEGNNTRGTKHNSPLERP